MTLAFASSKPFVVALLGRHRSLLCNPDRRRPLRQSNAAMLRGFAAVFRDIHQSPSALHRTSAFIGATVMPHNLYLHSSIVQTRAYGERSDEGRRDAIKWATTEYTIALMPGSVHQCRNSCGRGRDVPYELVMTDVAEIGQAFELLSPLGSRYGCIDAVCHCAARVRPQLNRDGDPWARSSWKAFFTCGSSRAGRGDF